MTLAELIVHLAPLAALVLMLLLGSYPGERTLRRRFAGSGAARRVHPAPMRAPGARTYLPRGGALIASALAGRAPPSCVA
ncbi:MAG: hypothetical protein ACRDL4_06630 [Thermoleophilaceae bacterium]